MTLPHVIKKNKLLIPLMLANAAFLSGCIDNPAGIPSALPNLGNNGTSTGTINVNPGTPTPTPSQNSNGLLDSAGYTSCLSSDPNHICLALKVVAFLDGSSVPVITEAETVAMVQGLNTVWGQCNIGFQLEAYQAINPADKGLNYNSNWQVDGDSIRSAFQDSNKFLVVAVGSLSGSTIAVTEMPGAGVYGTLVEKAYANNPLTVGHELGHYMGLYHISDSSNLMNPYIGSNTSGLDSSQCATARSTDGSDWTAMRRQ